MAYTVSSPRLGVVDLSTVTVIAPGITNLPSTVLEPQPGEVVQGWDTVRGGGEFIYLAVPTSTTVTAGLVYRWNAATMTIVVVPTSLTGIGGAPIAVAINAVASNTTTLQYTWFQIEGRCTILKDAVAVGPDVPIMVSQTTAGRVKAIPSAFRTIIGGRAANTATISAGVSSILAFVNRPAIAPGI